MKCSQLKKSSLLILFIIFSFDCFSKINSVKTISSNGNQYKPLTAFESNINNADKSVYIPKELHSLYKGEKVQDINSNDIGILTGVIFLKTKNKDEVLDLSHISNIEVIDISNGYYLVQVQKETELLNLIEKIKLETNIENAELEVNVQGNTPY